MVQHLPRWLWEKYILLLMEFRIKKASLTFEQIKTLFPKVDTRTLAVALCNLKNRGWLKVELNPEDGRKRLYTPLEIESIISEYRFQLVIPIKPLSEMAQVVLEGAAKDLEEGNWKEEVEMEEKAIEDEKVKEEIESFDPNIKPPEHIKKFNEVFNDSEIITDIDKQVESEGEEGL